MTSRSLLFAGLCLFLAARAATAQQYLQPLGHWNFNHTTGTTATDSVGGNHGTLIGVTSFVPGIQGNAIDFSGGHVSIPAAVLGAIEASPSENFAYSMWIRPESFGSYKTVVDTVGRESSLWINTGGDGFFGTTPGGGANAYAPQWTLNQWQHLLYQFDNATDTLSTYRNGVLNWSAVVSSADPTFGATLILGGNPSGGGTPWDGQIDDLQIYTSILNQSQINFLAANPGANLTAPEPASLIAWSLAGLMVVGVVWRRRRS